MAVIPLQGFFGGGFVQAAGFVDEFEVFERGRGGKFIDTAQREVVFSGLFLLFAELRPAVQRLRARTFQIHQPRVVAGDDGAGVPVPRPAAHFNV